MNKPQISVIIPCLNEEHYVGKLLGDLVEQNYQDFEVIVSDSGSRDNTLKVVESFSDHLSLDTVKADKKGLSLARNNGAAAAKGNYLLFLDADLRIPPYTLSTLYKQANAYKTESLLTSWLTADSRHPVDIFFMWIWSAYFTFLTRLGYPRPSGGCIFIKRSIHKALGGFKEGIEPTEDTDYASRADKIGVKSRYAKGLKLAHSPRRFSQDGRLVYVFRGLLTEIYKILKVSEKAPGVRFGHYHDNPKKGKPKAE